MTTNGKRNTIHFYFDPACPWAYVTSRWVTEVARKRDMTVRWRLFSLRVKNAPEQDEDERRQFLSSGMGHRCLRVAGAVREAAGEDAVGRLYAEMAQRRHGSPDRPDIGTEDALRDILTACGLDADLAAAAEDERWDELIAADMAEAITHAGSDLGVPIIALDDGEGPAWFGPVISRAPEGDAALALWDAFETAARLDGFFEMKRGRTERPVTS
jgi:predicted DsbA family dithiol-disulfide isomerase